jgi:hypothetical protein
MFDAPRFEHQTELAAEQLRAAKNHGGRRRISISVDI